MRNGGRVIFAALVLASAAATARADVGGEPEMPGAIVKPPPQRACELETRLRGRQTRDGVMVETALRNRSNARIVVTLKNECVGGAVQLVGLPAGYDVDSACNRGACVEPPPPRRVIIPSGAERVIGTTTIHTRGDSCNEPLPNGVYMISAQPRFLSVTAETCDGAPYRMVVSRVSETPPEPPPSLPKKVAPRPPTEPRPIPCGLACPNGVLDSVRCTCKKLELTPKPAHN